MSRFIKSGKWFRAPRAMLMLGLLAWSSAGCSKDKKLQKLWDGKAELHYGKSIPGAQPASKTDFAAIRLKEGPANLTMPVDWNQNPHKNKTWVRRLHRWEWMWPLLAAYEEKQDKESLKQASLLALDWIDKNPTHANDAAQRGWGSGDAAWRAEALGYLVRAATDAGLLKPDEQHKMLTSVREHAAWLANDENYRSDNTGSLHLDFGLAVMCASLNKLPDCQAWSSIARQRFLETTERLFDGDSGVHREHTPRYHLSYARLIQKMADAANTPAVTDLHQRVQKASGWLVPPDGRQLLVGDANDGRAPGWAIKLAEKTKGITKLGNSGYAVVSQGGSYLFTTAGFNKKRRKDADELSFTWLEGGKRIITDTGRGSKSNERFSTSAFAHNTLTVNGSNFSLSGKPYGSGIEGVGEADGWYAISARNRLLPGAVAEHRRAWLYRPGEMLLVIDHIESNKENEYDRYFHFWPKLKVAVDDKGRTNTSVDKKPLSVFDVSGDDKVETKLFRDQKKPRQGVIFRKRGKPEPNDVLRLSSKGQNVVLGTLFQLGEAKLEPADVALESHGRFLLVKLGDQKLALSTEKDKVSLQFGVDKKDLPAEPEPKPEANKNEKVDATAKAGSGQPLEATQAKAPSKQAAAPAAPAPASKTQ